MKLNEILNKKVDYEVVRSNGTLFHTMATIGGREIHFAAIEEGSEEWELSFGEKAPGGMTTYAKTNSGNELEVFSMVKDSILEFVSRHHPERMYFTADKEGDNDNNRANLYDRLIKRFKIPGYEYNRTKQDNYDIFDLVKK